VIAVHEFEGGFNLFIPFTDHYVNFSQGSYIVFSWLAEGIMFFAGLSFVTGLICLLASAVGSASARTAATLAEQSQTPPPQLEPGGTSRDDLGSVGTR
jgi:hypothetical protein